MTYHVGMADDERALVNRRERPRRPICPDCRGDGEVNVPRSFVVRSQHITGSLAVPGRCPSCRGNGKAGA